MEHTITESLAMGVDLVKMQLLLAQGHPFSSLAISQLPGSPENPPSIHSIQLRITAEDVSNDWALSVGKINSFRLPAGNGVRVDTHLLPSQATIIGTDFDSLVAKIIITGPSWDDVVRKARRALVDTYIGGVKTSLDILRGIVASEAFAAQHCDTQWLESNIPTVLETGKRISAKSVQYPGASSPQSSSASVTASSNVLFRKGDAWSISLTPEGVSTLEGLQPIPSHLQINRILRNEFPTSLTAQITYTSQSSKPTPYRMTIASTKASFGSLSSSATHRRGDRGNGNHIILPFAGKLVELLVDEGDEVEKGDVVAVVKQMKMELEIRASKGGRVVWIFEGEEGDDVGEGILIAELESGAKL